MNSVDSIFSTLSESDGVFGSLDIGIWKLFGIWCLFFGICPKYKIS
ncbi:hypothetical protein D1AOALGA4SA_5683 [Olavius algarvensis Delta 1 endosymbiont]|nr:hypothetical protein D1AOALGA4SA_5683 [Olavius algarvensis Delta 1 endosymbiont]